MWIGRNSGYSLLEMMIVAAIVGVIVKMSLDNKFTQQPVAKPLHGIEALQAKMSEKIFANDCDEAKSQTFSECYGVSVDRCKRNFARASRICGSWLDIITTQQAIGAQNERDFVAATGQFQHCVRFIVRANLPQGKTKSTVCTAHLTELENNPISTRLVARDQGGTR